MSSMPIAQFVIPDDSSPSRLDAVLKTFFPDKGMRAVRRIWDTHEVLVNGKEKLPGALVKKGDLISIAPQDDKKEVSSNTLDLKILTASGGIIAFFKPYGMHTAHIAGKDSRNLEDIIEKEWGQLRTAYTAHKKILPVLPPRLVTRLDMETSGIVLGISQESPHINVEEFRRMEKGGQIAKTYLAVIRGTIRTPLSIRAKLDTDNRKMTRVLPDDDPDTGRHTYVEPGPEIAAYEEVFPGLDRLGETTLSLVKVTIHRGARHQIRAHLAAAGFPIAGDKLYDPEAPAAKRLFLHHAKVELREFSVVSLPEWGFGEENFL